MKTNTIAAAQCKVEVASTDYAYREYGVTGEQVAVLEAAADAGVSPRQRPRLVFR